MGIILIVRGMAQKERCGKRNLINFQKLKLKKGHGKLDLLEKWLHVGEMPNVVC